MFWRKKKVPEVPEDQLFAQLITVAHASGDQRTELLYRTLLVALEAEKIRAAIRNIVDNYSDGLSDLTHDACHLLSAPLASELETLERLVIDNFESVEDLADRAQDVLIKLTPLHAAKKP
ncbi:Unknown protein sequence [Pseudomonas caricapapayae]|uniref:Uncharacterized protein n=1 Tax=Pseudomonas caricapapayae TaxID=46678 RepID=A0A0P9K2W1_9PSED|nr:hypothetical protein [Pseudomonas caricapapayae]KAA8693131.1 hypothetical protein F4W67_22315 [Pseudomonas caricapapayae]KPW54963.1 Unknown protein sequence [Pseudomonas caricapapayae]RMM12185.1 hypothetical protein ALQ84_02675 [Pseudomonas caricapapayae]RMV97066.1 hypothetical protein ALP01_200172 [Pseudomonas caricapapayae]